MSTEFTSKLESTKSIIEDKQKEIDTLFNRFITEYSITNENIIDAVYDYCYNDFESPILTNYLAELNDPD